MLTWTTQNTALLAASLLSTTAAGVWWFSLGGTLEPLQRRLHRSALSTDLFVGTALAAAWVGIFVVYGFPVAGDVELYYIPFGREIMAGSVQGEDFFSLYMPGFNLLMGILDAAIGSPLAIPGFLALCYFGSFILARRLAEQALDDPLRARVLVTTGFMSGGGWLIGIGHQQDECWMLLLVVLGASCLASNRARCGGAILGAGLMLTKILFAFPLAAMATGSREKTRVLLSATAVVALSALALAWWGFAPWDVLANDDAYPLAMPSLSGPLISLVQEGREEVERAAFLALVGTGLLCVLALARRAESRTSWSFAPTRSRARSKQRCSTTGLAPPTATTSECKGSQLLSPRCF